MTNNIYDDYLNPWAVKGPTFYSIWAKVSKDDDRSLDVVARDAEHAMHTDACSLPTQLRLFGFRFGYLGCSRADPRRRARMQLGEKSGWDAHVIVAPLR